MHITNRSHLTDRYGKRTSAEFLLHERPILSFPISLAAIPKEARYLSWELIDYDTIPLIGFPFIHWLAANVPVTNEIPEDFSRTALKPTIQGKNSLASPLGKQMIPVLATETLPELTERYLGLSPRSGVHTYTLYVYATKNPLNLKEGFFANELHQALNDQLLAKAKFEFLY